MDISVQALGRGGGVLAWAMMVATGLGSSKTGLPVRSQKATQPRE
jgi:hypothetical protein